MSARAGFPCQASSVTAARRFVREELSDQQPSVVDAAELLTSELASNCVRHANTDFEVAVESGESVRVEVSDGGRGRPRVLEPAATAPTGRGLLIVSRVAESWGVERGAAGTSVWFTLAAPVAAGGAGPGGRSTGAQAG